MRDTIDMIEEARQGVVVYYNTDEQLQAFFQRFEALIRADERNEILRMSGSQWFKSQARYDEAIRNRGNT
jgi:hypothetical protein